MKYYKECFLNDDTCGPLNKATGKSVIKEAHILSQAATMKQLCGDVNGQMEVYKASTQKSEGWRKASAYHCFCGDHDTKVFIPIENDNPFDPTSLEQLFLHTFRSFAFEYHQKKIDIDSRFSAAKRLSDALSNFANPDNNSENYWENELDSRYVDHMYAHEKVKAELIKAYRKKAFDSLSYQTFVIEEKFAFASAGTLMAELVSTHESSIVYYDESEPQLARPAIVLTVFPDPTKNSTNIILACLKTDKNASFYLDKFNSLSKTEILLAVSSLMLTTNRENTFFHPTYWDAIQNHPKNERLSHELKKARGFDLLTNNIKLSEFNLFDQDLTWKKIK